MAIAQFARPTGNYQFPTTPVGPVGLPFVGSSMQSAMPVVFQTNFAHLVDRAQHSDFCVRGYQSGLLSCEEMTAFGSAPSLFSLHELTNRLVETIGHQCTFSADRVLADPFELNVKLSHKGVDKAVAAALALSLIDSGHLNASDLHEVVSRGDYTAPFVQDMALTKCSELAGCDEMGFTIYMEGQSLNLHASEMTYWDFNLDDVPEGDRFELSVLMQKSWDALSRLVVPIQTPNSFCGKASYMGWELIQSVSELAKLTADHSKEGFLALLHCHDIDDLPMEPHLFNLESGDDEEFERAANEIAEVYAFSEQCCFQLQGEDDDAVRLEITDLYQEAQSLAASNKPTARAHAIVAEIFDYALSFSEADKYQASDWNGLGDGVDEDNEGDFDVEGLGFFELMVIRLDEHRYERAYNEGHDYINCHMQEMMYSEATISATRDLLARKAIPIMVAIGRVNALLTSLSNEIKAISDAA